MPRRTEEDIATDLARLARLLKKPHTMAQLVRKLDVHERTVFTWLERLALDGVAVSRVGLGRPTQYQIAA